MEPHCYICWVWYFWLRFGLRRVNFRPTVGSEKSFITWLIGSRAIRVEEETSASGNHTLVFPFRSTLVQLSGFVDGAEAWPGIGLPIS